MRRRITRAFVAAAAAGATVTTLGLTAAGSAGAATAAHKAFAPSAPVISTAPCSGASGFISNAAPFSLADTGGCAGYVGSQRDFRYAQAIIRLPQTNVIPLTTLAETAAAPTLYVGLTSGDAEAAAGFMTCANFRAQFGVPLSGPCVGVAAPLIWVAVGWVALNNGATVFDESFPLTGVSPGDGVEFQVYYPAGGAVHFTITRNPTGVPPGPPVSFQLPASGTFNAVFNHAVALVDYSASTPFLTPGPATGPLDQRITQFQMGAWTTVSGNHGTFVGPWTLNAADVTNNGTPPPGGTINVEPAYLWNDGLGNGFGDAFGVWWRV